jgi:hypothetical protein
MEERLLLYTHHIVGGKGKVVVRARRGDEGDFFTYPFV